MHAVFTLIGREDLCQEYIKWLECKVFLLHVQNPKLSPELKDEKGKILEEGFVPLAPSLRRGVLGTYEYIFPQNEMDLALSMLKFDETFKPFTDVSFLTMIKTAVKYKSFKMLLGVEAIPEFNKVVDLRTFMPRELLEKVRVIPLGVRYDYKMITEKSGIIHEAI